MATETRVYSNLVAVEFKLAVPTYRRFDSTEDKEGNEVWNTPDGETRHMKLVPHDTPNQWIDILFSDYPDRTVVKVGNRVTQRVTEQGSFPTLSRLISTHPVTDREEWIRLRHALLNVRRIPQENG